MAGLALGSWLFGSRAARMAQPIRAYALLEAGVAVAALLTLPLLRELDVLYAALGGRFEDSEPTLLLVKLALSASVLLPCTILMGGTLPVICQALARHPETAGRDTG